VRIEVDLDLCQGHAMCEMEAPDLFAVERRGKVRLRDPEPPESARAEAEAAVQYCPTRALTLKSTTS
jgi:ferredoxin